MAIPARHLLAAAFAALMIGCREPSPATGSVDAEWEDPSGSIAVSRADSAGMRIGRRLVAEADGVWMHEIEGWGLVHRSARRQSFEVLERPDTIAMYDHFLAVQVHERDAFVVEVDRPSTEQGHQLPILQGANLECGL